MRIYEFVDICHHERANIPDQLCYEIPKTYSQREWVAAVGFFLTHLAKTHRISGKVVATMWGICEWYYQKHSITNEQQIYLVMNFIENWNQLDPETFIQLNL